LLADALEMFADLRAAAVHHHRIDADQFISTMSRAKPCLSDSSTIALPPYLITSVLPVKRWI